MSPLCFAVLHHAHRIHCWITFHQQNTLQYRFYRQRKAFK